MVGNAEVGKTSIVRQMVREAEESSALYGSSPLDLDALIDEVYRDLGKEGIVD